MTVAFAALLATTFGAGLSVASADTIPGDTLYPVKRALEATQLAFKRSDSSSGNFHLHLATERLTEVDQLTNGTSGNLTTETLAEFQRQASLGSDELMRSYLSNDSRGDLAALNHFSASSTHQLADLRGRLSVADLEKTQELLDGLVVQSTRMCPDCSGSVAADSPSEPEPTAAEPIEVPTSRSIAPADGARVRHEVSSPPTIASPTPSASVSADATQIPTESPNMDSVETPPVAELMQKSAEAPAKPSADLGIVKKLTEQSDKLLKLPGSDNN